MDHLINSAGKTGYSYEIKFLNRFLSHKHRQNINFNSIKGSNKTKRYYRRWRIDVTFLNRNETSELEM